MRTSVVIPLCPPGRSGRGTRSRSPVCDHGCPKRGPFPTSTEPCGGRVEYHSVRESKSSSLFRAGIHLVHRRGGAVADQTHERVGGAFQNPVELDQLFLAER